MADDTELDDMMMVTLVEDGNSAQKDVQALEFENSAVDEWANTMMKIIKQIVTKIHVLENIMGSTVYSTPRQDVNEGYEQTTPAKGTIFTPKLPHWSDGYRPTASIANELPSMYDSEGESSDLLDKIEGSESKNCDEDGGNTKSREKVAEIPIEGAADKERKLQVVKSMSVKVCELMINTAKEEAAHQLQLLIKPKCFDEQIEAINMEAEDRNYFKEIDYEAKRQERLKQTQELFALNDNDPSADELIEAAMNGDTVVDLGKMIDASIERSKRKKNWQKNRKRNAFSKTTSKKKLKKRRKSSGKRSTLKMIMPGLTSS